MLGRTVQSCSWTMMSIASVLALTTSSVRAGNRVIALSVDDYTNGSLCSSGDLTESVLNGQNFLNEMQLGSHWTGFLHFTNDAVYDRDFIDSDLSPGLCANRLGSQVPCGADNAFVDTAATGIAYFTGHGTCGSWGIQGTAKFQRCIHSQDCKSVPYSGWVGPGACINFPPGHHYKHCQYHYSHAVVTCSTQDTAGGLAWYGFVSPTRVRLGESVHSGNWAGAGTNGGVNVVVFDISCGASLSSYINDLKGTLGGVHLLHTVAIQAGDTANTSTRGREFAKGYTADPNSSVADAWSLSITTVTSGGGCGSMWGAYAKGGINGCGAHLTMASGATAAEATSLRDESWVQALDDTRDAKGGAYIAWAYHCNYDCYTNFRPVVQ